MPLSEVAINRILDEWPVARLATRGSGGSLAQVPIVFARAAGRLWSPVDGKPKAGRELDRVRNVLAHPSVSLLLDHYDDDWSQLWWLRLDAHAEVVRPADPAANPEVAAAVAALGAKYRQYEHIPLLVDPPTLLAFRIDRSASWSGETLSGLP